MIVNTIMYILMKDIIIIMNQKQLYYYDRLCKKYSIEKKNVEELSKLDLRNEIERILNEHSDDYKIID